MTRTPTPVNFTLDLPEWNGSRTSQVAYALIEAIAGGRLHDGDRLPSTRTLAATFGLARTAVVGAYEELTAAGFLVAHPGGSTYVEHGAADAARPAPSAPPGPECPAPDRQPHECSVPDRPVADRQSTLIRYDLRPGQADLALISARDWTRAMRLATAPARSPDVTGLLHGHLGRISHQDLRGSSAATCAGPAGWPPTRKTSSCSPASPARCAPSLSPAG